MSRCIYQKCGLNKHLSTMLNLRRLCEVVARGQNFLIKISSQLSFSFLSKLAVVNLTAKLLIVGLETYRVGAYCNNTKFILIALFQHGQLDVLILSHNFT